MLPPTCFPASKLVIVDDKRFKKEIVYMMLSKLQKEILEEIDGSSVSKWHNWRWQVRHCIEDLDTFEILLNIKLPEQLRKNFAAIIEKSPMSITPYYLSLIKNRRSGK